MPYVIEPHEVLAYLNELGYTNITGQQLKEFIKDLKKLIKYDLKVHKQRTEREDIENVQPHDVFQALHETKTASSKAKEAPRKEKVITVQIKKPVVRRNLEINSAPISSMSVSDITRVESSGVTESINNEENITKNQSKSTNDTTGGVQPHNQARGDLLKPKASFIRPRIKLKPCKSDPVALYHQYQAEWKKQKFPGVENHATLRWAIRERMLGEAPYQQEFHSARSTEALSRKRGAPRRT